MPGKAPAFQASLLTTVGELQQLSIVVNASTPQELAARLGEASDIAQQRLRVNNDRVLKAVEVTVAKQEEILARAVRGLCRASGLDIPEEYAAKPNGGRCPDCGVERASRPEGVACCEADARRFAESIRLPNGQYAQEGAPHADPAGQVHAPADS